MIMFLLTTALLAGPTVATPLDSVGIRQPRIRLPEVSGSWASALLRDRMVLDAGETRGAEKARMALAQSNARYRGEWKSDFAKFRSRWPRALSDGSWPIEVAALWRTRSDQELSTRPGLRGTTGPAMLQDWVRWLETSAPGVRFALADLTGRELSNPGVVGAQGLAVGDSLSLDLSQVRFDGPVRIRIEQFVRRGLALHDLRAVQPPQTWKAPAAKPVWTSKPLTTPGLYRFVWQARGYYQQALVRVGDLRLLGISTDSGMLLWASGQKTKTSKLLWMTRQSKLDSLEIDLSKPVHLGFPAIADSGLLAVVAGEDFTTFRLHRPRPAQQDQANLTEERDRRGLPLRVAPRIWGRSGWQAASVLERDAFEPGELLRVSGWMRHLDAYGRPDRLRGDSLQWSIEPFSGPPTRRWVQPDSLGRWNDSAPVARKGRVHVRALAAGGEILKDDFCEPGSVFRIRDIDKSCLDARTSDSIDGFGIDTLDIVARGRTSGPSLLLAVQGRALDWVYSASDTAPRARLPSSPELAGGVSALLVTPTTGGWAGVRQSLEPEDACRESRFPLTIATRLSSIAKAATPIPPLEVRARSGPLPSMTISVRLVPDGLAASLGPMCRMQGQSRAASEIYTGEADWSPLGLGEIEFQSYGKRRDPDLFARIGLRTLPPLCIACGPWRGSWDAGIGKADLPSGCGWSSPDLPCATSEPISREKIQIVQVAVGTDGAVATGLNWPKWPGSWRLQAWGIDAFGRLLAWEKSIQVR